jgi:methyl-accepting chemotaxis protein
MRGLMKIKTKLLLNVVIAAAISTVLSGTSYVSMTYIKGKLAYLAERSTPFQLRSVEYERSIQAATADLIKVSAARNKKDLEAAKADAAKSLESVKSAQASIESMSGEKYSTYAELDGVSNRLALAVEASVASEEDAGKAAKAISQTLDNSIAKLRQLDGLVKNLQTARSATYVNFVEGKSSYADKLTSLEMAKAQLKDAMVLCLQSQSGNAKSYQAEVKKIIERLLQNSNVRNNQKMKTQMAALAAKIDDYFQLRVSGNNKAERMTADLSEKIDTFIASLENEIDTVNDKVIEMTAKNGGSFLQSNITVNALASNSELLAYGSAVDGLVTRLFTANSDKEIDATVATIGAQFVKIHKAAADMQKHFKKLGVNKEQQALKTVTASLDNVYANLSSKDGVVLKLKHRLTMQQRATQESAKLRDIVMQQAEKSRATTTVARGEQEKSIAEVNSVIRKSLGLIVMIGIAAIIIGLAFGAWIYRAISSPLSGLIKTAESIASGDLKCSVATESNDEIGRVQKAMAGMVVSLQGIAMKIGQATDTLAGNSDGLSSTAASLERGTEEQTGRIQQSAISMSEMSKTINEVSDNANSTATEATAMRLAANTGREKMHSAVSELYRFAENSKVSAKEVEKLGEQSEEITSIVSLINDIADQTNLLALNAAIEAARAGDAGRGFAVVADQVRQLAAKTAEATGEIVTSVTSMRSGVSRAVKLIQEESSSIDRVVFMVNDSVDSIDGVVGNMDKITDMVGRIAVAAQEQSATSDEVSNGMNNIAGVANQIKVAFADVKNSSENLASVAAGLKDTTRWFKL